MSKQLPVVGAGSPGSGSSLCCSPLMRQPLSGDQSAELARVFKALADPVRLRLLSLIACHAGGEACVCELTDGFELTGPTISHHLKVLREAGVIDGERRGTWVFYRVLPTVLHTLSTVLMPPEQPSQLGQPGLAVEPVTA